MAASAFIRLLESRGLLDPEIISELDRQVETSKVRVTPEAIAKLLVENGQLTRFQATKLIAELNESVDRSGSDPTAALRGGRPPSAITIPSKTYFQTNSSRKQPKLSRQKKLKKSLRCRWLFSPVRELRGVMQTKISTVFNRPVKSSEIIPARRIRGSRFAFLESVPF
jgi:hypothetical protein